MCAHWKQILPEIARINTLFLGAAWNGRCCIYDTDEASRAEGAPQLEAKLKRFETYTLRESAFQYTATTHKANLKVTWPRRRASTVGLWEGNSWGGGRRSRQERTN